MPSTTNYNFGDVVLVVFPFTNLQATKKRLAVVINSQAYQQHRPDIILMAITSQLRQPLAADGVMLQDWQGAGQTYRRFKTAEFALGKTGTNYMCIADEIGP